MILPFPLCLALGQHLDKSSTWPGIWANLVLRFPIPLLNTNISWGGLTRVELQCQTCLYVCAVRNSPWFRCAVTLDKFV